MSSDHGESDDGRHTHSIQRTRDEEEEEVRVRLEEEGGGEGGMEMQVMEVRRRRRWRRGSDMSDGRVERQQQPVKSETCRQNQSERPWPRLHHSWNNQLYTAKNWS